MIYPDNTIKLMGALQKEFLSQGIPSEPRIFSDLLEITDAKWQNAVEGYLNTQRFYILVEPQYYRIALDVYNKNRKEIHTVGLINTGKLDIKVGPDKESLAYVIKSDNRWAKAYALYLLNRVTCCEEAQDLKNYKVAITPDCMLYQNFAVRKIDERVYQTPYIGAYAFEIQLKNKQAQLEQVKLEILSATHQLERLQTVLGTLKSCHIDIIEENIEVPIRLKDTKVLIQTETLELKKAEQNPNYIQIQFRIEECKKLVNGLQEDWDKQNRAIGKLEAEIEHTKGTVDDLKVLISEMEINFTRLCETNIEAAELGLSKFREQSKLKSPTSIVSNYSPLKTGLENKRTELLNELVKLQLYFCNKTNTDLGTGIGQIQEYINEHHKLVVSDIIKYEEDLERAKDNCHLEFRESFLARLKENIETAKREFRNLNVALKDIYYGEDSYKFELTANKKKENIYQMITSNKNELGFNLWSQSFDQEYKEEMEDLFSKLTAYDDKGEKVLAEYTDYRGYLDYDIIVEKKDGTIQRFSKIYGEKSGGETQTPYYVAIAASFVQLYKSGDTIRIIMFDEAFDKMDDNRISSMMDFLNSQNFQIILATPPAKLEVIGEKVDTILMAMREGTNSIIEEYDL